MKIIKDLNAQYEVSAIKDLNTQCEVSAIKDLNTQYEVSAMNNHHSADKILYSVDDIIRRLGLSRQTVYNELNSGRLGSFKVGRRRLISPDALAKWIDEKESA